MKSILMQSSSLRAERKACSHVSPLLVALLVGFSLFGLVNTGRSAVLYYANVNHTVSPGENFLYNPLTGGAAGGVDYVKLTMSSGSPSFADMSSAGSWELLLGTSSPLEYETLIKVADGTTISSNVANATWSTWGGLELWSGGVSQGYHKYGETAYYGIRSLVAPATYGYGWIQIQRGVTPESWTILSSAFDSSGEILAGNTGQEPGPGGAVPEPSTIIGFFMGGSLLYAARRRSLKPDRA